MNDRAIETHVDLGVQQQREFVEGGPEELPNGLRELTEEEVVAAARAFWLDDLCEQRDEDDGPALLWEH